MTIMSYGEHLARKCSIAVAVAVLKSKPPDMATQEYVMQLQSCVKSSFPDKYMDVDEITISSQDFDDDVIEDTMATPVECGSLQNIPNYSQRNLNSERKPQSEINPTVWNENSTWNENEKNTYLKASEMYEECGQKLDQYSKITGLNQSNVNMATNVTTVNNDGRNHENTATNTKTDTTQPVDQTGLDDIMFSQNNWKDKFHISTEHLIRPQPNIVTINDQEKVFIKKSVQRFNIEKNLRFPVSTEQNITGSKNKINMVLAESQNKKLPSQSAIQTHNQDTEMVTQCMENSQKENMLPYHIQNMVSSFSPIIVPKGQNMVPYQCQNVVSHKSQNIVLSQSQNMVPYQSQNMVPYQSQNLVPAQSRNLVQAQSQHVGLHQSQNIVQFQSQNMIPPHHQNMVQSQIENIVPLQNHNTEVTCTVNETIPQTQNMLPQQMNCIEMLSQAITKPDIEVNNDIDIECNKDVSKGVPFKIIMEMNKVKHILSCINANAQDSGYRSDSQLSSSCRSTNTGYLLSDDQLNQAAHTLVHHLHTCSGPALEHPVTSEVSATVADLVDALHGVRSYPIFLDELLERVGTVVEEICSGESSGVDALLKKEESFHRLALLSESMEITTYAIDKLLDSLEQFHRRLTKDPERTYEVGAIDDMENQCYAFQGLETLIVKYMSKKGKGCDNRELDLIQQTLGDPSPSQTDLPSSITELWRKRWDSNYKTNTAEIKCKPPADITNRCGVVLKKFIVGCMDGHSLVAYSALECFNCLQS